MTLWPNPAFQRTLRKRLREAIELYVRRLKMQPQMPLAHTPIALKLGSVTACFEPTPSPAVHADAARQSRATPVTSTLAAAPATPGRMPSSIPSSPFTSNQNEFSANYKEFNLRPIYVLLSLFVTSCLSGCSSQQIYNSGQAWQRNECNKIIDGQERSRCLANSNTSYEDYKRQTQEAKDAK